jgi:hypothetical protein
MSGRKREARDPRIERIISTELRTIEQFKELHKLRAKLMRRRLRTFERAVLRAAAERAINAMCYCNPDVPFHEPTCALRAGAIRAAIERPAK